MSKSNKSLELLFNLAKTQAMLNRRFDNSLGGLGFNEFIILSHLDHAPEHKLRRIDLAEKLGLTASGITRILLPMEKIGLVSKESPEHDARISLVILASGGKRKLTEALERAELLVESLIGSTKAQMIADLDKFLTELGKGLK